jgi:3-methyladenine DNA glycosylase AlkD
MDTQACYEHVKTQLAAAGNPDYAEKQRAYMKHRFDFFGVNMPAWAPIAKAAIAQFGVPDSDDLKALVRRCFEDEHREMHYFALELTQKALKKQPAEFVDFLEELITTESWWDSVDWVNKLVGIHFKRYPMLLRPVTARWMDSGNIWLQRVCLICQLTYRERTDSALMFEYIKRLSGSKEFFIQKGAGWALRQYSRTNPEAVREFVAQNSLAPLTRREALRLIG